ncbi:uncharacterized protein KNN_01497 [Bacillus thuringiensis serovar tolworthi]|uniref:Uncharacterized protein n=1 Tax=Bacillus thuringiensis subsp. tolworthi TaxID=1442 RepID=A0A9W3ZTN8_BACTO|nr:MULTISPECIES: hypothetical protein [Bacillus cereus group]MEB8712275.1 hypothetical protein [Bacillus cereus]MEB9593734.1 hypothetical protein [Bacillus cereus]BAR82343.1 uncharacterized protein KNN_01497 [Bacillus thuringiensis serovar tolworthi]
MMQKKDIMLEGLKCDVVIYDEMIRFEDLITIKIKEQMKLEQKKIK